LRHHFFSFEEGIDDLDNWFALGRRELFELAEAPPQAFPVSAYPVDFFHSGFSWAIMKKYRLHLFVRALDWVWNLYVVVLFCCSCAAFIIFAAFVHIREHNWRKSFELAVISVISIVIGREYYREFYTHIPHAIFVDEEKGHIYLKGIFGKLPTVPMREIQKVETHFWFCLMYFPTFLGYKKVKVPESVIPGGFFIISPFFRKREELLDTILKEKL